jgi:hypothetical protein
MSRLLAKWDRPAPASFLKSATNTVALTHKSLLTYPTVDLAGDYVNPEGCDFTPHMADPVVDLEHRRHRLVKSLPVAWARASFEEPGAPYAVEMVRLNFAEEGKPDDWHTVPVGTEFYKSGERVSMQVFALREQGALPASSLEFAMLKGFYKEKGWSDLEGRKAYHFDRVSVHRWTVCERGVNPGALLLGKSLGTERTQVPVLERIIRDRRVNVGGRYEPLHPTIIKALAAEPPAKNTTVRVEKGMQGYDDTPDDLQTATMDAAQGDMGMGGTGVDDGTGSDMGGPTPTAKAAYDLAQSVYDLCEQTKAGIRQSEHKAGRKEVLALCAELEKISRRAMLAGHKVSADVADDGDGDVPDPEDTPDEGDETAEGDESDEGKPGKKKPFDADDVDDEDMEEDEDTGVLKGIPLVFRKSVKRFSVLDVQKAQEAARRREQEQAAERPASQQYDPGELAALREEMAALKQDLRFLS